MRPFGGKVGKPEAVRPNLGVSDALLAVCLALADQVGDGVAEGDPVRVSVDLGKLTGVVGEIDIGSHIASMHRFENTCKISDTCQIDKSHVKLPECSRVRGCGLASV